MNGGRQRLIGSITATVDLTAIGGFSDPIALFVPCSRRQPWPQSVRSPIPPILEPTVVGMGFSSQQRKKRKMQWGFPLVLGGLRS